VTKYHCTQCKRPYPEEFAYICKHCGGLFDIDGDISFDPHKIEADLPGLWKYRHSFGLDADAPIVTLGEGGTPLHFAGAFGMQIGFKLEYLNPTGSFKDRLTAPEMSYLVSKGIKQAVEDSSGNAGASFAAYAGAAGIKGQVYVPDYASGPKRKQIDAYGAEVIAVPGPRSAAARAVMEAVENGAVYASHAYLPFGHVGLATVVYEIYEQLGRAPGTIISPAGHGSLLLGIIYGFIALQNAGLVDQMPVFVGVQAAACAPLAAALEAKAGKSRQVLEGETYAEGVRVKDPVRGEALLELADQYDIRFAAVEEDVILPGRDALAKLGMYVEPTSAIVWDAIRQVAGQVPEPIVSILTGSGLKSG